MHVLDLYKTIWPRHSLAYFSLTINYLRYKMFKKYFQQKNKIRGPNQLSTGKLQHWVM